MKDAFNELCEISHANKGIDQENTIGRRTLLVQSVCIKAIHALTPYQNERLEQQLKDIASTIEHRHLHFRDSFFFPLSYHRHINESPYIRQKDTSKNDSTAVLRCTSVQTKGLMSSAQANFRSIPITGAKNDRATRAVSILWMTIPETS